MKNKFYLYCILCFLFNVAGYSQSTVFESLSFESNKLGRKVSYSIYLPSDYNTSKRNYPVLYLLHGYTDNETNWIQMGQMKTIADRAIANEEAVPMIIVMPDAWDTWYINQYDGKVPYEDMFFEELIPYMEKTYRIRSDKESRQLPDCRWVATDHSCTACIIRTCSAHVLRCVPPFSTTQSWRQEKTNRTRIYSTACSGRETNTGSKTMS